MYNTNFWLINYKELFNKTEFFPKRNMTRNEILNSLTRYSLIMVVIFFLIGSNGNWYYLPIGIIIGSIILFLIDLPDQTDKKDLEEKNKSCREPNINNPYMNVLVTQDNVNLPNCDYDKEITDKVDEFYKFNLYQNSDDIFDKKNLERQFYTMPISTIPNKQIDFANWLYKLDGNCKHDNVRCLEYEDERYN